MFIHDEIWILDQQHNRKNKTDFQTKPFRCENLRQYRNSENLFNPVKPKLGEKKQIKSFFTSDDAEFDYK